MGLFDGLTGTAKKELEDLRKELSAMKSRASKAEAERDAFQKRNVALIDKTHAFLERLRLLVSTLEDEHVLLRTWDLLDLALSIKKGGIFTKTDKGWHPTHLVGFESPESMVIPLDEESMPTFAASQGVILSLQHLRKQDDLAWLERRGSIQDVKIACPVRIQGEVGMIIVICHYGGNVFDGENDLELIQMVATTLGLVATNTRILADQKAALEEKTGALIRLREIFSHMVDSEVIEYIEKNPAGIVLGGIRQEIVVMFVDIRGFTQMAEELPPERVIDILNLFFTNVTELVIKHKGTLDKFMGDSAMVLFGTPVPIDKPVFHAVCCAEEIQDMVQDNMGTWVNHGFPAFSVGVGINFQDVLVGNVGSKRLSSFTAIGDGVNTAFRLCSLAAGGEILVTESVFENIGEWEGKVEQRPRVSLKGKAEPVTVYALSKYQNYLAGACPKCGIHLQEGVKFCGGCGYRRY